MKKIMMLIAVAMAAVMSQAAFVDWSATGMTAYNNQAFYGFDSAKQSDVLAALAAVDDSTATTLAGLSIASGTVKKGKALVNGIDVGSATSVMGLVLSGEIADGTSYTYITEDITAKLYTPPDSTPGTFNSTIATAGTKGTMSAAGGGGDVPEPTSGLLLLVGGAMLALRRKQK